jgi:FkbM family methyltransferase
MSAVSVLRRAGNKLYEHAFAIYRPLYATYKAYTERPERKLLRQVLFPGAVVVDGGANIGIYSRFLSRCVGPRGVVHSFEPSPDNFRHLRDATRHLDNVRPNCAAIGDYSGPSKLYVSEDLNVDHRAYMTNRETRRSIVIEMVALDDYFKVGETVNLIKFDLQGYELHALRGAKRVLHENPTLKLLLEFWPYGIEQAGAGWEELVEMLQAFRMDLMLVRTDGLIPFDACDVQSDISWYVNLFASRGIGHTTLPQDCIISGD